jgi:hypothetical protein
MKNEPIGYTFRETITYAEKHLKGVDLECSGENFVHTKGAKVIHHSCFRQSIHSPGKLWAIGKNAIAVACHPDAQIETVGSLSKAVYQLPDPAAEGEQLGLFQ